MSKVKFNSPHPFLTVMRSPVETTRSVQGVLQIVKEDKPPFKFENGDLSVSEKEAAELRKHPKFGVMFHEVPGSVSRIADKNKGDQNPEKDPKVHPKKPEVKTTKVEGVKNFNEAVAYLKDEFGLEHTEVNSKEKIIEKAAVLALEFPDYTDLNEPK